MQRDRYAYLIVGLFLVNRCKWKPTLIVKYVHHVTCQASLGSFENGPYARLTER
jgi:hypothetical protein